MSNRLASCGAAWRSPQASRTTIGMETVRARIDAGRAHATARGEPRQDHAVHAPGRQRGGERGAEEGAGVLPGDQQFAVGDLQALRPRRHRAARQEMPQRLGFLVEAPAVQRPRGGRRHWCRSPAGPCGARWRARAGPRRAPRRRPRRDRKRDRNRPRRSRSGATPAAGRNRSGCRRPCGNRPGRSLMDPRLPSGAPAMKRGRHRAPCKPHQR